jgi:hypothetical protein
VERDLRTTFLSALHTGLDIAFQERPDAPTTAHRSFVMRFSGIFPLELCRVIRTVPRAEWARRRMGPLRAVESMRRAAASAPARHDIHRLRLRRAVGWVDRIFPGGPNCYRRVLLEIALDRGAANEPLMLGFRAGGQPGSGHAWLASDSSDTTYDAVISV